MLKVYGDIFSQPTRAILIFCKANGLEHEFVSVRIDKLAHVKPEFAEINPLKKLPAIDDDGFKLPESHAIMRYLAATRAGVEDHWYPKEPHERAQIDAVLDWHHLNIRKGSMETVFNAFLAANRGLTPDLHILKKGRQTLKNALRDLEKVWLRDPGPFVLGRSEPSIADLSIVCELMQLEVLDAKEREGFLNPCPRVRALMAAVEKATSPYFTEVHTMIRKLGKVAQAKREEQAAGSKL
ncbi:glutathione transferase [Klebsormidium nitens]|uniref:Glutathione transferase n=1 Tax=Klebsormidium nitens TaxID=105231 RepID=A0A1Y1HL89_KLENI|nr:glutathione transferase [Klebsormidium nitens]|eukprot:GAQ79375.1 glutathione transferase [Klebsormidium nitens]